jgi:hypothetical protein
MKNILLVLIFLGGIVAIAIAAFATFNMNVNSQNENDYSLTLANIVALSVCEEGIAINGALIPAKVKVVNAHLTTCEIKKSGFSSEIRIFQYIFL